MTSKAIETNTILRPYLNMKTSLEKFGKPACELSVEEQIKCQTLVDRQLALHNAILQSPEALKVSITSAQVTHAMKEVEARFSSRENFETTLYENELSRSEFALSLHYELHSDTVLEYVSQHFTAFTVQEAQRYYFANLHKFKQPERRAAAHILITINDQFPENKRDTAYSRLMDIRQQLSHDNFGYFAERYSECPTAMNEGKLGMVERHTLHPQLDKKLFTMAAPSISGVLESEIGFHLLYCPSIMPAHTVPFSDAKDKILSQHNAIAKMKAQRNWISKLLKPK